MNKKIRVGMDISQIAHQGGVATYTKNLAQELSELPDLEMVYFYSSLRKPYKGKLRNVKSYRLPPTFFEILFNRWRNIPIEKFIGSMDIFHSSDWTQPKTLAKTVTTYHDVIPLKYPQWSHPKIISVHKRRLKLVEREVNCVIAVSQSTKNDLLEVSHIPAEKIKVVYEAASSVFKPQAENKIEAFKKKYNLPAQFILAIGGVGERRNLGRIKEATKRYQLVVSGEHVPYLSTEEMVLLYSSARVLLYASFYEGFGLPILEAMASGTPVVTSSTSGMQEVGGEAVLYVNPVSVEDIREKIRQVMEDEALRKDLIKKGFSQVEKFSWEKCAEETFEIYKNLLARG